MIEDWAVVSLLSSSGLVSIMGVLIRGLGEGDGALFRIARGGSILKISSSGFGGP